MMIHVMGFSWESGCGLMDVCELHIPFFFSLSVVIKRIFVQVYVPYKHMCSYARTKSNQKK